MEQIGVFGPSKSGKTTLVKALCREFYRQKHLKTIALDPHRDKPGQPPWGPHAVVFTDEKQFWETVWASKHCVVAVDEATQTIARDKDKENVFTAIRHNFHHLIVIGHNGTSLTPIMRQQLEVLFLFLQSTKAAKIWIEETACEDLIQCVRLGRYEFIRYARFEPVTKHKLAV